MIVATPLLVKWIISAPVEPQVVWFCVTRTHYFLTFATHPVLKTLLCVPYTI